MKLRIQAGVMMIGLGLVGCAEEPMGVEQRMALEPSAEVSEARSPERAATRASLLTQIPVQLAPDLEGWLSITELSVEEAGGDRQLYADGIVSWIDEDGQYLAETFTDHPLELSRTTSSMPSISLNRVATQRGPSESGVCDVLYLSLGPLYLDLLGLTVDLSNIQLDVDAVPGAGNLLGNLLCAVTNLLNGGPLAALLNLLGQINDILDAVNDLLNNLSVVGSALSGDLTSAGASLMRVPNAAAARVGEGQFSGNLTVTELTWDDAAGTLLVDGILSGKTRQGGRWYRSATW